jgi:hypothetical protein
MIFGSAVSEDTSVFSGLPQAKAARRMVKEANSFLIYLD